MKSRKNIHRRKTTKVHRRRKNQRGGNQEPAQDASQPVVLPVDNVPAEFKP